MKVHPLCSLIFCLVMLFITLTFSNPFYIISIAVFMCTCILVAGYWDKLRTTLLFSLYNAVFITLLNPLLYHEGKTILYKSPRLPVFGKIKITLEALAYGANMGVKLICIVLIFLLYSLMTDKDAAFTFFSKYANRFTLTVSMTVNIIHRLKLELERVRDVMLMRGVRFDAKSIFDKVKSLYPLLKVILISSLEGSIDRAEALHSRMYGKYKRSHYFENTIRIIDVLIYTISGCLIGLYIYCIVKNVGLYIFYPRLQAQSAADMYTLIYFNIIFAAFLLIIWGSNKWQYLKRRI